MKKQALYRIAVVSLFLLAVAFTGRAQAQTGELIMDVPFDFNVGEKTLPAGEYAITRSFGHPNMLVVRRTDNSAAVLVYASLLTTAQLNTENRLVFNVYRGQRFLVQVQSRSGIFSHEFSKTRSERRLVQITKATDQ